MYVLYDEKPGTRFAKAESSLLTHIDLEALFLRPFDDEMTFGGDLFEPITAQLSTVSRKGGRYPT